ncbi:hypothetical protein JTE90_001603 [Oedothorax gibbosus]|uniref:IGFBP N-terminal domain-containing protein n=1 Tax=Oedothorax gibbosus TaxID=931172 RepID=A0AAV6VNR3_9ARAC|nr:hypothetical protein JTE90_001603 [Oedothorax gibbosus]
MKSYTLGLLSLVFIWAVVESTSPRRCPEKCDLSSCDVVDCKCGIFKDECDCCDICMKCQGESCHILVGDVCEPGYTCGEPGRDLAEQLHHPATCIPGVATTTEAEL